MKPWQWTVVGLTLLAIAGCRSDPAVPILERELRLKEDEIYRLRATLEEFQEGVLTCQQEYSASTPAAEPEAAPPRRRPGAGNGIKPLVEMPSQPTGEVPESLKGPAGAMPPGIPEVPEHLKRPSEPLDPREGEPSDRTLSPEPSDSNGPALEKSEERVTSRRNAPLTPAGDSRRVAAIALNRTLTGGISDGRRPEDQGLLVVVEPRDAAGRTVDAPAEMSVVVLDPAIEGEGARVARWDFTAAETAAMFRRAGRRAAIHLTTAWPADPPAHNKLHLFVRYVTADGRKLQTDMPIEVALPGDRTARWTPSDAAAPASRRQQQQAAAESWHRSESPTARVPGPMSRTATRPHDAAPRRPVWSPERK